MANKEWDKVTIETKDGTKVGIAPVIISASRATDIPAFHAKRFIERLDEGYIKWVNPFNRDRPQYVSFEKTRVIVFWTKNPKPIIPLLPKIDEKKINYYFTYTLNDYENEGLEPNLPPLEERIKTFKELSNKIGKERVIWRFDPLILSETITVKNLLDKVKNVGGHIHPYTTKLIVSFVDIGQYASVQRNLGKKGNYREFNKNDMIEIAKGLQEFNKIWKLDMASCCEEAELKNYGITHNRCIDGELMANVFPNDRKLMNFLLGISSNQNSLFMDVKPDMMNLKDKGQRQVCGCIISKDIGRYNSCMHLCTYCYANHTESRVAVDTEDPETL